MCAYCRRTRTEQGRSSSGYGMRERDPGRARISVYTFRQSARAKALARQRALQSHLIAEAKRKAAG